MFFLLINDTNYCIPVDLLEVVFSANFVNYFDTLTNIEERCVRLWFSNRCFYVSGGVVFDLEEAKQMLEVFRHLCGKEDPSQCNLEQYILNLVARDHVFSDYDLYLLSNFFFTFNETATHLDLMQWLAKLGLKVRTMPL